MMSDFKTYVAGLYETVKPEFRIRIFYGGENSAFDILTTLCESAVGLTNETNLKFCFCVYVDFWVKMHTQNAEFVQAKTALTEKYHTAPAEIVGRVVDKSLEIILRENKSVKTHAAICPDCGEKLLEGAKFCGKCGKRVVGNKEKDVQKAVSAPENDKTEIVLPRKNNIDNSTEIVHEQSAAPAANVSKQSEPLKAVESKPSPKVQNAPVKKAVTPAPQRGVEITANSAQKFPLRLFLIASFALVIVTAGIILGLVLANGSAGGISVPDISSFMDNAEKYLLEMDYEQAILEFDKILEIDPMNVDAYLGKAEALIAMGKTDEARELLETAYTKTGDLRIFDKMQPLIQQPELPSTEETVSDDPEPMIDIEPKDPVFQDPMCLAIEKTISDYMNGKPITNTENFDKVTDLYILGTKVYVACGNRYGTGQMKGWGLAADKITYSLYTDNDGNYVNLEETSGPLTDISFIKDMKKLKKLHIDSQKKFSDISPLAGMSSIKYLVLDRNAIADISPLENMTQLISLHLFYNSILDISPVKNMKKLRVLYFGNNNVSDISPVAGLTELRNFWIEANPVRDISAVRNLTLLTQFVAGECGFSDISALSNLTELKDLSLGDNNISDISALSNLTKLEDLALYSNNITNISPISKLTNLTSLYLGGNSIYDISPLYKLTNLEYLSLWGNYASEADVKNLGNTLGLKISYWKR